MAGGIEFSSSKVKKKWFLGHRVVPIYDSSAVSQTLGFRTMNTTSLHCTVCLFTSQLLLLSVYSARCVNDVLRLTLECRTCDLPIINPTRLAT